MSQALFTRTPIQLRLLPFVVLLLCCVCFSSPASAGKKVLTIDYPDFWPFFTRQENGKMTGFFYEIVTEALGQLDVDTRWRVYPWKRCQNNVRHGDADAMITVPTGKRLMYADTHPDPFYLKKLHVFTYKDNRKLSAIQSIRTLDDIKDADLTVITYAGNGWNEENIQSRGIKTHQTSHIKNIWRMLAEHRGDIVIEWPPAAWAEIKKTGELPDQILQTAVTFNPMPFHLLIGKHSPLKALLPKFNAITQEMQRNGRIEQIVSKYSSK